MLLAHSIECHACSQPLTEPVDCLSCGYAVYCGAQCQEDHAVVHAEECHLIKPLWEMLTRIAGKDDETGKRSRSDGEEEEDSPTRSTSSEGEKKRAKEGGGRGGGEEETSVGGGSQQPQRQPPRGGGGPRVNVPVIMSGQPTAAIGRDLIKLLFEYFEADAATMMGVTRLWQSVAQQIDWKRTVLARLDKRRPGVMYSLGEWIYTYNIFALFPNLLPFPADATFVDEDLTLVDVIKMIDAPEDRLRLMAVMMLYYMYEEDCLAMQTRATGDPGDAVAYEVWVRETVSNMGHGRGLKLDWKGAAAAAGEDEGREARDALRPPVYLHFPVGVLTREVPGTAATPRERNLSLIEMSELWGNQKLTRNVGNRWRLARLGARLRRIKNLPKALLQARYMFSGIFDVRDCPQWSPSSFEVLAGLSQVESIVLRNPLWTTFSAQCLQIENLVDFSLISRNLETVTVPPSLLTPFPDEPDPQRTSVVLRNRGTGPKIRGIKVSRRLGDLLIARGTESVMLVENFHATGGVARVIPPFREGDELIRHVTDLLFEATNGSAMLILSLRASAISLGMKASTLKDSGMYVVVSELYAWLAGSSSGSAEKLFLETVDRSAASIVPGHRTSFRLWYERGLGEVAQEVLLSHARELCRMSAERRRGPGAVISLEEMAEAFGEWVQVDKRATNDNRYLPFVLRSQKYIERFASGRMFDLELNVDMKDSMGGGVVGQMLAPEMCMAIIRWSQSARSPLSLRIGGASRLPVWLWLCSPNLVRLSVATGSLPCSIPDQLMYHPGLRSLILACRGWTTPNQCVQWNLMRVQEHAGGYGPYVHDFSELWIDAGPAVGGDGGEEQMTFPPLDLRRYQHFSLRIEPNAKTARSFHAASQDRP